ncbi:MAG TPA: NAD(P)/FAD-dependent oxidoreductase [Candidatus Krumholzibacteria bacterium]|nr:NAD(P)/FAD-dependent oxidoreductase [Candidatus Krumholzibacteria bacterium]
MNDRDVIVVGAGPAGSTAASVLARRGRDVLLVDRAEFPRDKVCGDGIPPGTVGILNELGMAESLRAAGFQPIDSLRLVSARGRDWRLRFRPRHPGADFFIAPRLRFDDLLRSHAVANGASFQTAHVRAPLVESGRVVGVRAESEGVERELRARIVIGADGATSAIARSLVPDKPPEAHRAVAIRAYLDDFDALPRTVEFHFGARFAPGYAWVFPLGERRANVGVIVRTDRFKRRGLTIESLLREFIEGTELRARGARFDSLREVATWQLSLAAPDRVPRAFDGALLAGDAARLVDALTGEGIHNAVVSGKLAGEAADRALASGHASRAALSADYEARLEAELGRLVRRSYRYQKYITAYPPVLEAMFVLAGAFRVRVIRWLDRVSTDFRVAE